MEGRWIAEDYNREFVIQLVEDSDSDSGSDAEGCSSSEESDFNP